MITAVPGPSRLIRDAGRCPSGVPSKTGENKIVDGFAILRVDQCECNCDTMAAAFPGQALFNPDSLPFRLNQVLLVRQQDPELDRIFQQQKVIDSEIRLL